MENINAIIMNNTNTTIPDMEQIGLLANNINSDNKNTVLKGTTLLRVLLSTTFAKQLSIAVDEVIKSGVIPRLIRLLHMHDEPLLQFESSWILTNVLAGTTEQTKVVVDNGGIEIFMQLLNSPNKEVKGQAVWALRNIAGDSRTNRDIILNSGGLPILIKMIKTPKIKLSLIRDIASTISNLCRGKPSPPFQIVKPVIPLLSKLISYPDSEIKTDACWALSYISDGTNEQIQTIINNNICPKVIELLQYPDLKIQIPALRVIGNILTGSRFQTQIMINLSILPFFYNLLQSERKGIRRETCWSISNITAGNTHQIQAVIEANLIPPLIDILSNGEFISKKEAGYAISNAISHSTEQQIDFILGKGCMKPLLDLLKEGTSPIIGSTIDSVRLVNVILSAIENILKCSTTETNKYIDIIAQEDGFNQISELSKTIQDIEILSKIIRILFFGNVMIDLNNK